MRALVLGVLLAAIGTVGVGVEGVWAQAKVHITREESKPKTAVHQHHRRDRPRDVRRE